MEIKSSVLDYLGKFEGGIMVLIALTCEDEYYEGVFFYTEESIVFSIDEKLEQKIGCKIEEWVGYAELLRGILKDIVPYNEMISRIDEVDFSKLLKPQEEIEHYGEEIDPSEIIHGTMSVS